MKRIAVSAGADTQIRRSNPTQRTSNCSREPEKHGRVCAARARRKRGGLRISENGAYPKRLAAGQIATLSAIDGSTVYRSFDDLVATLRAFLWYERAALVQVNVADVDARISPNSLRPSDDSEGGTRSFARP
jgi:hypothetical protein